MTWTKRALVLLICLMLAAPLTLYLRPVIEERPLGGVTESAELPKFSWAGVWDSSYMQGVSAWFAEQIALRRTLIRLDNQINYSVFNEFQPDVGSQIYVGRDHWLFSGNLLRVQIKDVYIDEGGVKQRLNDIRQVQDLGRQMGKPVLLIVAPMKWTVYPDQVDPWLMDQKPPNVRTFYEKVKPWIEEAGVEWIDGVAGAQEFRAANAGVPTFLPESFHWAVAYCPYVVEGIFRRFEQMSGKPFPHFEITDAQQLLPPYDGDADLRWYANVFRTQYQGNLYTYPAIKVTGPDRPMRVAIVGDSFSWSLGDYMTGLFCDRPAIEAAPFYYYFNTKYGFPRPAPADPAFSRDTFDVQKVLEENDALLIVVAETALYQVGFDMPPPK